MSIRNFRGISRGEVRFHDPHVLLVGSNNTCKSTILEALDLALGPDRAYGAEVIDEHDFYHGNYMRSEEDGEVPKVEIRVILGGLSEDEFRDFRRHVEPWNLTEFRPYTADELQEHTAQPEEFVLPIGFEGWYDEEEDEFTTSSFFFVPEGPNGERDPCGRKRKQAIGFLFLRALRTARRAASLQRGSLLDLLLRERASRAGMWQAVLEKIENAAVGVDEEDELSEALGEIQASIDRLIPLGRSGAVTGLHAGRLTRRHLRDTMTYFLSSRESEHLLPFDRLGSGTANILVFALLTAIAESKRNIIFAMEEPEIALAPHTQRLMVERVRMQAAQSIVTSHSPYVAELFLPDKLVVTRRGSDGAFEARGQDVTHDVKEKTLRQQFRSHFAEGLLGRAVAVVEGVTELWGIPAGVDQLAVTPGTALTSFDLEGLVFVPADGHGDLDKFASYFKSLGVPAHVVCDNLPPERLAEIRNAASSLHTHGHEGFEALVAKEIPIETVKRAVGECRTWDNCPPIRFPDDSDDNITWRQCLQKVLKARKGEGWSARVLSMCRPQELPGSLLKIVAHLRREIDLEALPHDDPLAALFRDVDANAVHPDPPDEQEA